MPVSRSSPRARSPSAPCRSSRCASRTSASSAGSCTPRPSTAGRSGRRSGRRAGRTGMVAAGYRAIDALRLEKGYRVWSSDITPDETPFEAGPRVRRRARQGARVHRARRARRGEGRRPAEAAALPRPRRPALGLPRQRAGPGRWRDRRAGHLGRLRLRGRAVDRVRLPAARPGGDRDARRGRGLRRVDRLRGRPRAALRPRRCEDQGMTDESGRRRRCGAPRRLADLRAAPVATPPMPWRSSISGATSVIETKPDRTFVTQADTAIERTIRGLITATYPGPRPRRRGVRHRSRDRHRPLVHRPDRRHPQLHARRPVVRHAARGRGGRRDRGRGHERPGDGRALVRAARRRHVGGRVGRSDGGAAAPGRRLARRGDRGRADPLLVAVRHRGESGLAPGFPALVRSAWRDRGFGDFWGYALVAEGAAEAMVEVGPNSWDLAAPSIVVEEAGGRMTDIRGERTIHGGSALATNGILHDEIVARLRG